MYTIISTTQMTLYLLMVLRESLEQHFRRATFRIRGNAEHIATVKIAFTTINPLAK